MYLILTLISMTSERPCQVWGGGSSSPPYLSQPFMGQFSKFFCLVKACENPHWFLFHRQLSIVHHMAARRRQSDEGHSHQYFQGKSQILQFLCYINVIYLKRTHFSCRIQIQTKRAWFIIEKFEKIWIFPVLGQKRGWPGVFDSWFLQFFYNKPQKWLCQELLKGLNLKVTKYELIISNQSEMADDYLPGGAPGAPPMFIRVNY